jgi:hypothetical protein
MNRTFRVVHFKAGVGSANDSSFRHLKVLPITPKEPVTHAPHGLQRG